jgi:ABC-type nickel/cobalt efflux system permease component RcnA
METRDVFVLAVVMVVSSLVLTYRWLSGMDRMDPWVVLASVVLIGSLAAMLLLVDLRLRSLESTLEAKERSLRISIKSVEENLEKKINAVAQSTSSTMVEFSKRMYR